MRSAAPGWVMLLVGLALMLNPASAGGLGAAARSLATQCVQATDLPAQSKAVAAIYRDTAAKLADGSLDGPIESNAYAQDRVQRESAPKAAGWNAWLKALAAEQRRAIGDSPDRAALQRMFQDVATGMDGAW